VNTLSVNVMTRGPGDRVAALLALLRPVADEILVALDDRAGPELEIALGGVADRLIRYPYAEPVDRPLAWIHAQCESEWILTVDDDEIPSRALLGALPELVRASDVTHYWLPRRWLYPARDRYLDARPWRPDYQPRLVLNDRRVLSFPAETHVPLAALGPSRYLDAPLYHADCLLNSTEAREAKAKRYERLHPGKRVAGRPLNEAYYLPERVDPPTREVPAEDVELIAGVLDSGQPAGPGTPSVRVAEREEIDRHWAGRDFAESAYRARLTLLEEVPPLRAGSVEKVGVLVENLGGELWPWGGAGGPEISLGSRWLHGESVEEGARTPLPADLPPGNAQIVPLAIAAPEIPGRYTLEVDLVHEHARWFSRPVRTEVEVAPHRLTAVLDPGSLDGLVAALEALDPAEEPLVITSRAAELARSFAGRIRPAPEEPASRLGLPRLRTGFREAIAGTGRLVVPEEILREGRRLPLLAAVLAAQALGIPAQTTTGEPLTAGRVRRRALR
jgi:hypothetical protein